MTPAEKAARHQCSLMGIHPHMLVPTGICFDESGGEVTPMNLFLAGVAYVEDNIADLEKENQILKDRLVAMENNDLFPQPIGEDLLEKWKKLK
jgi:hypothetical protein